MFYKITLVTRCVEVDGGNNNNNNNILLKHYISKILINFVKKNLCMIRYHI